MRNKKYVFLLFFLLYVIYQAYADNSIKKQVPFINNYFTSIYTIKNEYIYELLDFYICEIRNDYEYKNLWLLLEENNEYSVIWLATPCYSYDFNDKSDPNHLYIYHKGFIIRTVLIGENTDFFKIWFQEISIPKSLLNIKKPPVSIIEEDDSCCTHDLKILCRNGKFYELYKHFECE